MYLTHSYKAAYPREIVEYPPYTKLSNFSPGSSLANAPFCHKIGATSLVALAILFNLVLSTSWHNSVLSSNNSQNLSKSPFELKAISAKLIEQTPPFHLPAHENRQSTGLRRPRSELSHRSMR